MANVPPPEHIICYLLWWQGASFCPNCFSCINRYASAANIHSAMASRRRPTRNEPCNYAGPAFEPSRVLLRRVFFLNDDKSRYVSVGFYLAHNYQPLFEYGGTSLLPLVMPADYVKTVAERLPGLMEAKCRKNTLCGSLRTRSLDWITLGRRRLLYLHSINTRSQ